jgi:hypothetical protein
MRLPVSNLCFRRNSEFNSDYQRSLGSLACHPKLRKQQTVVEPIGIEPTTSSLQSSRSPNWATAPVVGAVNPTSDYRRFAIEALVGPGRVERPTSRLSGVRSNHLSYEPVTREAGRIRSEHDGRKGNEGGGTAHYV